VQLALAYFEDKKVGEIRYPNCCHPNIVQMVRHWDLGTSPVERYV
jgi:hypothetical protein